MEFLAILGLCQKSVLNPFLFILVIDELNRQLHDEAPQCMLLVHDIIIVDEIRDGLRRKLNN